ncbi:MAG: hypothetical protein ACYTG0_36065 [Planctomycetota bacterium]
MRQGRTFRPVPEKAPDQWPDSWQADFGDYRRPDGPATFRPTAIESEHTWVDFARYLRPFGRTNMGTQPTEVSAYAMTSIVAKDERSARLIVGFDDWLKMWVNGHLIAECRHDDGFATAVIPARFRQGENRILVKLSDFDNEQWRLWAYSFRVESGD